MLRIAIALLLSFVGVNRMIGQILPEYNMSDDLILTDCRGILYDSGGENGPYGQSENISTTISTNGPITLTFFNQFCVQNNFDFLNIYDGVDDSGMLLGQFTGVNLPPTLVANSGAVTLVFTSDLNVAYCGFSLEWESELPPPPAPTMQVLQNPICNSLQFNVNYDQIYPCNIFSAANFTVYNDIESFDVVQIAGCSSGQTAYTAITLDHPIDYNCTMYVELHVEITNDCGVVYPFDISTSFDFQSCGINAIADASDYQLCSGECTQVFANVQSCSVYTYTWNQGLPATAGPHEVCPTANTTYSVTITDPLTQTSVVRSITITTNSAAITTPEQTICQSADDIALTANATGIWSGPGVDAIESSFDPDSAAAGLNYLYFTNGNCIDSVGITVTPIQAEEYTAACQNTGQFALHATPAGGTWSGVFTSANGLFNPLVSGNYVVTYILNGCSDETNVAVQNISGAFTLDTLCQSVWYDTISFAPPGGTWSGLGIVNDSLGVYAPEQTNGGWTTYNYAINGCDADFQVYIKPIDIGGSYHTTCPEEAPLVWYDGATPTPPGGFWTGDGLLDFTTGLFDPGSVANDSYSQLIYAAPNGCADTITVFNLQTTITASSYDFCATDTPVNLEETEIGFYGPQGGVWTGPGIQNLGNNDYRFNPSMAGPGIHTIYYEKNTCVDSLVMRVFNHQLFVSFQNFCSTDAALELDPQVTIGGTWSGSGIVNSSTGLFDPSAANPGQYYIYWETPAGCNDSILVTVETFELAEIDNLNANYCILDQTYSFEVSPDGGTLEGIISTNSFNPSSLGAGDYQVIYTYDGPFCVATADTAYFTIHPALTNTLAASDLSLCQDQQVTVTATTSGGYPGSGGYSYQWSTGGQAFNSTTTALGSSQFIHVSVNDGCGPSIIDSIYIEVLPPIETIVATSDTLCVGEDGYASVAITPAGGDYQISWNTTIAPILNAPAGTSWQLVVLDNATGCETTPETVIIPGYPNVNANFIVTPNSACISFADASRVNIIDLSQNATLGMWDFGNGAGQNYAPGQNLTQNFASPGNYQINLYVMNDAGCEDTSNYSFCVLPEVPVFVPDIFSPNGDGNNDVLFVRGNGIARIDFHIYNRWGEEVFATTDPTKGWDGQLRGSPSQSGTYFYTLKIRLSNDTPLTLTGEVILVR
jgi:gliding motility-associated-like protein